MVLSLTWISQMDPWKKSKTYPFGTKDGILQVYSGRLLLYANSRPGLFWPPFTSTHLLINRFSNFHIHLIICLWCKRVRNWYTIHQFTSIFLRALSAHLFSIFRLVHFTFLIFVQSIALKILPLWPNRKFAIKYTLYQCLINIVKMCESI